MDIDWSKLRPQKGAFQKKKYNIKKAAAKPAIKDTAKPAVRYISTGHGVMR